MDCNGELYKVKSVFTVHSIQLHVQILLTILSQIRGSIGPQINSDTKSNITQNGEYFIKRALKRYIIQYAFVESDCKSV
jgi:hypothetical protein